MTIDKVMNNLYDALSKIKILSGSIIKDFAGSLVMTYLFIHDIYFIQGIALKIDV